MSEAKDVISAVPDSPSRETEVSQAVHRALGRWYQGKGLPAPSDPEQKGRMPLPRRDSKLEFIDELLRQPLGQAWIEAEDLHVSGNGSKLPGVVAPLPRRKLLSQEPAGTGVPSMSTKVDANVSFVAVIIRVCIWILGYLRYKALVLRDSFAGRNTLRRRARHFRSTLESLGPTFVKLGQQLSLRADILPYEYCEELASMLDRVPPFPSEQAIAIVERNLGRKVTEVFQVFDPNPIGSASLSCVYQALLPDGQKVAVKVRRPGIRQTLASDLRGLAWLMEFAELITVVRSGMTRNLRYELSTMLLEECDFSREARYTELFRKEASEAGQKYLGAPRVFNDISTDEVLVTEFIQGVFLSEIMGALDRQDEAALKHLEERGIVPRRIAENLVMAFNWETLENSLFHADPHPANIVVRDDNSVAFIDFGSCGRFGSRNKRLWRQFHYYLANEDVVAMTETAIAMLEPLPPVDLDSFQKEVEALYWDWLYAMKSDTSEWWEKASGVMWMKFIALSQKYQVPVNIDTLKGLRVTFLFDTIVFRLCRDIDLADEYQRYHRRAGRRARKRLQKTWTRRVLRGPTNTDYLKIEEFVQMQEQISARTQRYLDTPQHSFSMKIDKAYYIIVKLLQVAVFGLVVHVVAVVALNAYAWLIGEQLSFWATFFTVISHPLYQVIPITIAIILIRKVLARLNDYDV